MSILKKTGEENALQEGGINDESVDDSVIEIEL